ncbi:NF-kappa-B essential modulator isoform X2 [Ostrinia furnacalis]|nr:NF-kappa-B essential modulator isoform X2 [Ostrinia furnacalis]XP_028165541.1 NF-kappa-B essential modulator isoform X2 [Ostrinia furnacalis]
MMAASTIVTDDSSTEELQKRFGELLDENVILKETLKQNNDSMKEQFLLIASCQEDMLRTQELHKEKFEETKELVERLRLENKKLKADLLRKVEVEVQTSDSVVASGPSSGPSSGLEFVSSPDDDTIYKLTAQLELVEKQRRQVLVENEKLTWQKESLEHIVDATSKERDELKEKLQNLELKLSSKDSDYGSQIISLKSTVQDLHGKLQSANSVSSISSDELTKRDSHIQQLEAKVSRLQTELKESQLRVWDLENIRLEFSKHKSEQSEAARLYKEQLQELQTKLKDAQITVFQPVRLSLSAERDASRESDSPSRECNGLMANVRLYDRTLKHLADLMNALTHGLTDSIVGTLGLVASLQDFKLEKTTVDQFKASLSEVKQQLDKLHNNSLGYVVQVRSTLSIFEGIFKDYNELLKKSLTQQEQKPATPNVEALTNALLARAEEIANLQTEVRRLRNVTDDTDVLKAQLDLYRSDFDAEREAREKMACEKENIMVDLRTAQRRIQELVLQLDEVRKINPDVFWTATTSRNPQPTAPSAPSTRQAGSRPTSSTSRPGTTGRPAGSAGTTRPAGNGATKKTVYQCPKCMRFKSESYAVMDDHLDYCLDSNNDPCSPV